MLPAAHTCLQVAYVLMTAKSSDLLFFQSYLYLLSKSLRHL